MIDSEWILIRNIYQGWVIACHRTPTTHRTLSVIYKGSKKPFYYTLYIRNDAYEASGIYDASVLPPLMKKSPWSYKYTYTKRFNYYYIIWFHSILFSTFVMIYEEWICYRQVVSTIRRIIYKMIQSHNYRITNTTFNCIWYVLFEIDDNFNKNVAYRMITFHKWHSCILHSKAWELYYPFVITFVLIRILLTSKGTKEFI